MEWVLSFMRVLLNVSNTNLTFHGISVLRRVAMTH